MGWLKSDKYIWSKVRDCNADGKLSIGWLNLESFIKVKLFNPTGRLSIGLLNLFPSVRFCNPDGKLSIGWLNSNL